MELEKCYPLEATRNGFRCEYTFHRGALIMMVFERMIRFDESTNGFVSFWRNHANVGVALGNSRESARAIVEHHVRYFDDELAGTLGPVWATWDAVPLADLPPVATDTAVGGALH